MCIIIDTNMVGDFVNKRANTVPLKKWLDQGKGKLINPPSGTRLHKEYNKGRFKRALARYRKTGVAVPISASAEEVENLSAELKPRLKSNDSHIIALAIVSGAKLLASNDKKLGEDFREHKDIRGKIYKDKKHESLLNQNTCPL